MYLKILSYTEPVFMKEKWTEAHRLIRLWSKVKAKIKIYTQPMDTITVSMSMGKEKKKELHCLHEV